MIQKFKPLFIFLQETWLPDHEANILANDFKDYDFITTSADMFEHTDDLVLKPGPVWHGTALGWKKSLDKCITKLPVICERFCSVKYVDPVSKTTVILYSTYLPTSGQDDEFLESLTLLNIDLSNHITDAENPAVVIGADTNVSSKSTRRRYTAMQKFFNTYSLKTILTDLEPTFHHNNQSSESQIDHIFFSVPEDSKLRLALKCHLCLKQNSSNLSSHDVLVGEMVLPATNEDTTSDDFSSTYTSFVVKKPNWNASEKDDYEIETAKVLQELLNNYKNVEFIPLLCELFSKALVISAENKFETSSPSKHHMSHKHKPLPYFSKEYKAAHSDLKNVCRDWRKAGRPSDNLHPAKSQVLQSRRNLQRIARNEDASKSIKFSEELMETFRDNIVKVSSKLKKYRGENIKRKDITSIETLNGTFDGHNVLEGFAANTEILCNEDLIKNDKYDNNIYEMFVKDNMIIFDITSQEEVKIPHMNLTQLKKIIFQKLKANKACDVFMLTVEHLRYAGDDTLLIILELLNMILDNINVVSSSHLNTSVASVVYKGKDKSAFHHKSYRLVRVTPLFGRLIDEYMRPDLVQIVRPIQNTNQYGFTETVSYLMGALQRHEVEKYCIDMKKTFFGCSLDGDSAFEVVNRDILTRELYCAGERGDFWQASHYSYQNSLTKIKMKGLLSRDIIEKLGVKQGRNKSSDHYKVYIAPLLDTLDSADLGVWVGPINVSVSGVADDIYPMSDKQTKLQSLLDIAAYYGQMYRIEYGASKTKITVVGSEIDTNYFRDISPWKMNDDEVKVVEDNEHLGQIVSGTNQEQKNIDLRISKGRKCLFGLLGAGFAFKCFLSPVVKLHIYRTYVCPVLRSGLSSFSLRSSQLESLALFQRKLLKSILKLSSTAPTPAIHFLTGELPLEGKIHRDVFSLFFSVWSNPDTKIYEILKYLLQTSSENSRTWAAHIRHLCQMYSLEDPLAYLNRDPPTKSFWKELVATKITAFHENNLRIAAGKNSQMKFLNVSTNGLRGRHHPALSNMITTWEVKKSRSHLKFLSGNYLTYKQKSDQSGGSPRCRICKTGSDETISHLISTCHGLAVERTKLLTEYEALCSLTKNNLDFGKILQTEDTLCQFILDPASLNLPLRVHLQDSILPEFYKLSRDFCHVIDKTRVGLLNELK